ncbi:MAG: hypothetical protein U0Y96_15950 [Candidatus Kapaibacterium sp.]
MKLIVAILVCVASVPMFALPQYTLITGNRCINCHVNAQGSGLRNDLGFLSTEDISIVSFKDIGLSVLEKNLTTNQLLDGKLTYGLDFRMQSARKYNYDASISPDSISRKTFPMQASIYASVQPVQWFYIEGQYNFGRLGYTGQREWAASLNIQPSLDLPSLRAGFFQPSIGIRYDDHTMLVRTQPDAFLKPLIAPYLAEWGTEVRYNAPLWFDVSAGIFTSKGLGNLSFKDTTNTDQFLVDSTKMSLNGRIAFTPRFFEETLNTNIGASILNNGDFTMINSFVGIGWQDHASLMIEYMMQGNKNQRQLRSFSSELMYKVYDPLYVYVRAERGNNDNVIKGVATNKYTNQYVFGVQAFILPFIELRPEYRIIDTEEYYRTRWTVQLHVFY